LLLCKWPRETSLELLCYPAENIILFDKLLVAGHGEALQVMDERLNETSQESFLPLHLTKSEVLQAALSMAQNKLLNYYTSVPIVALFASSPFRQSQQSEVNYVTRKEKANAINTVTSCLSRN
jgi:hypothetical protein